MINRIKDSLERRGFVATLQLIMQKIIGVDGLHSEVETLQYFLNTYHKPSEAPPANDPDLRILQLCNVQLLRIVTEICDKNNLAYWIAFGTLLGSIRHKGFIPWDDDMDIEMPRSDYNKALTILRDSLKPLGITLDETNRIGIGYKHLETGIWLDIFAIDEYKADSFEEATRYLEKILPRYRKVFESNLMKATTDWKTETRHKIIGLGNGNQSFLYNQPEFPRKHQRIRPKDVVFPLIKKEFEGYQFNAPYNPDAYLTLTYGRDYMGFPRKDILHHDMGRGALSTWARRNKVDMNAILSYLSGIHI